MDRSVKAARAKSLLQDEILQEAFSVVEENLLEVFRYPNSSQEDIMEAHRMVRALDALRTQLEAFVADGKMAERRKR